MNLVIVLRLSYKMIYLRTGSVGFSTHNGNDQNRGTLFLANAGGSRSIYPVANTSTFLPYHNRTPYSGAIYFSVITLNRSNLG